MVALEKEQRGWKGILARVRERHPEWVVSGKSCPKVRRQMDSQTSGGSATKDRQRTQFPRGTKSQSGMREGWGRLFL